MIALLATDHSSNGWEEVAAQFIEYRERSRIGVDVVRAWARTLNERASILDLGCGSGVPISRALIDDGFVVSGIDASDTLAAAYRRRFPGVDIACEPAETSSFFGKQYDGVIAIGLIFLLTEAAQRALIAKVGSALKPGGRFLFNAPSQECTWDDLLTGRHSCSLGITEYLNAFSDANLAPITEYSDEGQNHYYDVIRQSD